LILAVSICAPALEPSSGLAAAEVVLPAIAPYHSIYVQADTLTRETRGSYEVLAFRGNCSLRQGELSVRGAELILWLDRTPPTEATQPRKVIGSMEGQVEVDWNGTPHLRDQPWMGRLFSFEEVDFKVSAEESRGPAPRLAWPAPEASRVAPAQYTPPAASAGLTLLPPASNSTTGPATGPATGPISGAAIGSALPAPALTAPNMPVPSLPGAMAWPAAGGTNQDGASGGAVGGSGSTALLPPGGLVIPEDGSLPYPAYGSPGSVLLDGSRGAGPAGGAGETVTALSQPLAVAGPVGVKSIRFLPRSGSRHPNIRFQSLPEQNSSVATVSGGAIIEIAGVQLTQSDGSVMDLGAVTIEFDNAVIWKMGTSEMDPLGALQLQSTPDQPIEMYLEGNIVLRQGRRAIYAERMYYNITTEYGMVLSAEVLTPVPEYQGLLRLKADVLEQRNRQNFLAYGAAMTSSRLGVPRYWLQADRVQFQDRRGDVPGMTAADVPGNNITDMQATSRNNFVYAGGVPIAYWPIFSTNLARPSFYLTSLQLRNDRIFGTQFMARWDLVQLLSLPPVDGVDWTLSTDYFSARGPALGTRFTLDRPDFFLGPTSGTFDAWGIAEQGLDMLGSDRMNLVPEADTRGRAVGRFRSYLTPNTELWTEVGWISDRNFLEQYFENEWDQQSDYNTGLRFRHYNGNRLWDISGRARVNEFFTETEHLPRLDHYWLGQDLGEYLTWSAHTSVGYLHQRVATTPTDPADAAKFTLLPWESDSEGVRALTRQELNAPLTLGAWNIVPFVSGEAGYWGEDVAGNPVTRLMGQGGVRASLPFWRAYSNVESQLLDIRGLAHKVTLRSELFYADATENIDRFPLYDPLDDNSQEHFRRRMIFNTFGGTLPAQYDERNFALRQGMQRWITATSPEVADDLTQMRLGLNQRWQTRRGVPGRDRIVDLVALDVEAIYFPRAERDNFGEEFGALNYAFRYHVGDRLTLLSEGYADVFSQGLRTVSAGAMISRPGRADAYLGVMSIEGPISSNILNGHVNYRLDEKWIASGGAVWDFSDVGSVGQTLALTRIGESALVRFGVNVDSGRDNVSFLFNIEPRFFQSRGMSAVGGQLVPPAGMFGVE
jgi:hypothetical protein